MSPETLQIATQLRELIGKTREFDRTDILGIFMDCESINGMLSYLITPLAEAETEFRHKVFEYMEEGMSNAAAEAKAKAGKEYQEWRKLDMLYKRGDESVRILKKFKDNLEDEYKRT